MRQFVALKTSNLPSGFDHTEGSSPIVDVEENESEIRISYRFPGFYRTSDPRAVKGTDLPFVQVNMDSVGHLTTGGKPLLPSFGRYVQIPVGFSVQLGEVRKGAPLSTDGVLVLPSQASSTDAAGSQPTFDFDASTYDSDDLYPQNLVEISTPLDVDGYRAVLVHVRPLQTIPKRRLLVGYGDIDVTLKLVPQASMTAVDSGGGQDSTGNLFLNPKRRPSRAGAAGQDPVVILPRGPEYLILYAKGFLQSATALAAWKNRKGLRTEIVDIGTVGNNVTSIKKYLRTRRSTLGSRLRYALLFGDADDIVAETVGTGSDHNASDYYYSTRTDPTSSTEVILPWMSIGRIPVRSEAEGQSVVRQIIAYERNPPADPTYYRHVTCAAYFQGNHPDHRDERAYLQTMEQIRTFLVAMGFNAERVYVSDDPALAFYSDGTPIPAAVRAAILPVGTAGDRLVAASNEGRLYVAHRDHGSADGWYRPPFGSAQLDRITSTVQSMFFSINCLTGTFATTTTTECFAEKILRLPGGAPTLIAATELSNTWLNNYLIKGLFDATYGGMIPTFPSTTSSYPVTHNRIGDILNYAKTYLPTVSSGAGVKDHNEIYHVIGDPTLEVWRDAPRMLTLSTRHVKNTIAVTLSECPRDCVVTVWDGADMVKRIEPTSNRFTVPVPLALLGHRLNIACYAPGCRFTEAIISL